MNAPTWYFEPDIGDQTRAWLTEALEARVAKWFDQPRSIATSLFVHFGFTYRSKNEAMRKMDALLTSGDTPLLVRVKACSAFFEMGG